VEKYALSIGERWLPYRKTGAGFNFTIHSTFNKVINISTNQGLLSVAAENSGGSSSFLTVSGNYVDYGACPGQQCHVNAGNINLANQTINFSNAKLWKGPIAKGYRNSIKSENIAAFRAVLDRKAPPQSAWRFIQSDMVNRFQGLRGIMKLSENPQEARNLVGLGPGLTPSGDDMLIGFMAIANHTYENREFVRLLHSAIASLLPRTTDISAQALSNALDRDYCESVQNCIRDLCEGSKEEVYISAASLMNIGATSGSDIACGMYFGMIQKQGAAYEIKNPA